MSSRSISSAKISGVHLKVRRTRSSPNTVNILALTLKHRASPHCNFSVASGNDRQYFRISSTFMLVSGTHQNDLLVQPAVYHVRPQASKPGPTDLVIFFGNRRTS